MLLQKDAKVDMAAEDLALLSLNGTPHTITSVQSSRGGEGTSKTDKSDKENFNEEDDSSFSEVSSEGDSPTDESSYYEETVYSAKGSRKHIIRNKEKAKDIPWRKDRSEKRGKDYPAFKGRALERKKVDSEDRITTPHASYSLEPETIKGHIPETVRWDGTTTGFHEYKYAMEGHYTQYKAAYLFDEDFQRLYKRYGPSVVIDHPELPKGIKITRPQLDDARTHLFGAIQQTTRKSNTVRKFINAHKKERDGILVWMDLVAAQDNDGHVEVREMNLIAITNQVYSINYPGGLSKYIEDVEDAFAGLDELGSKYGTRHKMTQLLNNLQMSRHVNDYLISHCRDTFDTFEDCVAYLKKEAIRRETFAVRTGERLAKMSLKEENTQWFEQKGSIPELSKRSYSDPEDIRFFCEQIGMEPTDENIRMVNAAFQRNPAYFISKEVFEIIKEMMSPELFKKFLDRKAEAEKGSQKPSRPNENIPPVIPRQYQKEASAKKAQVESEDDMDFEMDNSDRLQEVMAQIAAFSGLCEDRAAMSVTRHLQQE